MLIKGHLKEFYFTYGTHGQPYSGGWTVVLAGNLKQAVAVFRIIHPDKDEGLINCADFYSEEKFKETEMYKQGNFGAFCHERISLLRYVNDPKEVST
ncbi:MAG: hypothetical protein IJ424_08035 [Oscillospiraceae bacterium]|nr:hypothetical protein [Oscillospiraceae bacterium]